MSSCSGDSSDQWSESSSQNPMVFAGSSSSSPPQRVPENSCVLTELLNSVGIQDLIDEIPYLKITEQPQRHHKFRYMSEMENSHGCLFGRTFEMDRNSPKSYPEVELFNYVGKAKIKCQLVQVDNNFHHPHGLCVATNEDISVEVPVKDNYKVRFRGLCIIRKTQSEVTEWVYRGRNTEDMTLEEKTAIYKESENLGKLLNLNSVRLKFSAHYLDSEEEICDPVYSDPIQNSNNSATNMLKICRMSHTHTRVNGGDDVIMLVEKVSKKNIKIRFFEENESGDEIWTAYANFLESDVHYQRAIVFRTPPYKDQEITKRVKVQVELVRPTDGRTSDPKEFYYTPGPTFHKAKKRKITHNVDQESIPVEKYSSFSSMSYEFNGNLQSTAAPDCPTNHYETSSVVFPVEQSPMWPQNEAAVHPPFTPPATHPPFQPLDANVPQYVEDDFTDFLNIIDINELFNISTDGCPKTPMWQNGTQTLKDMELVSDSTRLRIKINKDHDKFSQQSSKLTLEDQVTVQKMVKQLHAMVSAIRIMDANKKATLVKTLEGLFDYSLSNGDTFLHLILESKQPLLNYVIDLIHESNMTHLLNMRNGSLQTILHLAVIYNLEDLTEILLSKGCDPMLEDIDGNNAIHYAMMCQRCLDPILTTIKKLNIPHDLEAYNNERQTALHLAVICKSVSAARQLLQSGASYNARDSEGRTPLHLAAYDDCLPVLAALLDHVRTNDIDEVDDRGYTALQIVCDQELKEDSLEKIKLLLEKNANPTKKRQGHSTSAWRLARDKHVIRDLMRKYIAEDPESSDDDDSDDEFESADEGDMGDQDAVADLTQPLNKLSITAPAQGDAPVSE